MKRFAVLLALLALILLPKNMLFGHCDTMNGPVVTAVPELGFHAEDARVIGLSLFIART